MVAKNLAIPVALYIYFCRPPVSRLLQAEDRAQVCSKDRDAAVVLRGLLEDRETRLRGAEQDASEAEGRLKEAAEKFGRSEVLFGDEGCEDRRRTRD